MFLRRASTLIARRTNGCALNAKLSFSSGVQASVVRYREFGDPAKVLKVESDYLDAPTGSEVLVKFLAAAVHGADLSQVKGFFPLQKLPAIAGVEGAAVVQAVGPAVTSLAAKDVVISAIPTLGTWRTYAVCDASQLLKVDSRLAPELAATVALGPCTAYRLLSDFAELSSGEVIVQNAPNSAVGLAVLQLAKARGLKTINIVSKEGGDAAAQRVKELGGTVVFMDDVARLPETRRMLSDLPAPKLAINGVGGAAATDIARLLANKGVMVTYGAAARNPVTVPSSLLIQKDVALRGFSLAQWLTVSSADARQAMVGEVANMILDNQLTTAVKTVPFADLAEALALHAKADVQVVLTM